MRFRVASSLATLIVLAGLGFSSPVQAQGANKIAAEALFDEARKLMDAKSYAEACTKFEQSQRLDPAIGTLLYLGDCYERVGRLASAWATFREGASSARAAGQTERAVAGEKRADLLGPKLSRLTIEVAPENRDLPGFELSRSGTAVDRGLFGVEVPVDSGKHQITAKAPGYEPWSTTVQVGTAASRERVTVPALVPSAADAPPADPAPEAPLPTTAAPPASPSPPTGDRGIDDGSGQRTLGLVVGAVGVVGLGVGTVFGLRAISKNDEAKEVCPRGNVCDEERGVDLTDDAKSAALISNIGIGVGAAALVGGVVLYLTAPSSKTALSVSPRVSRQSNGFVFGGRF